MTLPFAASFAVAPTTETISMPAYNPDTQMSLNFVPCEITGDCWSTYVGQTCPWEEPCRRDYETDCDDDTRCYWP